jgi:hypothetical protein
MPLRIGLKKESIKKKGRKNTFSLRAAANLGFSDKNP